MKNTTMSLIVVAAVLFSSAALAADETENMAEETGNMTQPAETETDAAVSAEPIMEEPASAEPIMTEPAPPAPDKVAEPARDLLKIDGYYKQKTTRRPKNLDLRHCLDLENNIEIAKCAGE